MADINLDFLSPEKREFLRRRAEQRGSTVEEELERAIGEVMEGAETEESDADERPRRPIDELESSHTPETLAEARRRDRELNRRLKGRVPEEKRPEDLSGIIGMFHGDGTVSGRNFHEYLYGEDDSE